MSSNSARIARASYARNRQVVELYHWGARFKDVAKQFNVSKSRASQMYYKGVRQGRDPFRYLPDDELSEIELLARQLIEYTPPRKIAKRLKNNNN